MTTAEAVVAVVVGDVRLTACVAPGARVAFGKSPRCEVRVPTATSMPPIAATFDGQVVAVTVDDQVTSVVLGDGCDLSAAGFGSLRVDTALAGRRLVFDLAGKDELTIGPAFAASVTVASDGPCLAARRGTDGWVVSVMCDDLFVNSVRQQRGHVVLRSGDRLGFGAHEFALLDTELHLDAGLVVSSTLPARAGSATVVSVDYPDVRRSPRLIYRAPEGKITINAAPAPQEKPTGGQLAKLIVPPVLMLAVTVVMTLMRGNLLFVMATAVTTVATLVFSISSYVRDRRKNAAKRAEEDTVYREYLVRKSVELHAANNAQRGAASYHYPDISELLALGLEHSPRIFERTRLQFDFLSFRLGLGQVASSSAIEYADAEHEKTGTELAEAAFGLYEASLRLDRMPIVASLMQGPVGYVGPRRLVVEQLQLLINQLAVFHSYHDLQFVIVFGPDELPDWEWMRWLRHATLQDLNVRGFVHDERSRDQVLASLNQILKSRSNAASEARSGRQSTVFTPHYVVVVLDETLILDHVIMEFLREDPTALGCSVVFVKDTMSSLSDRVSTVIDIRDRDSGVLVLEQGELRDTPFALDHFPARFDAERLPRALGALNHVQDLKSSIPQAVTFLELYGVERFEELGVEQRWAANSPHRTLGVPLGLRGPDDVVKLDLHEKAHGPHGLVAGTTGSGKSEIIQSYILSLAVNFHPHDVAFLLIDYKGGGMADLFTDLPHLLGTITNLDGAQAMRALVSINAELKRRQRVFSANKVNHINQYQKLVKQGDASEPMPHLFLISDEFAELKAEQPEFMNELVSTARIGRSLGIHLILATQKPTGVVNDQIWSNSKFKLALKVADRSDSMEIIKTPDAAEITLPGRAYLQVGNNEIYELFQSAWSGADYTPDRVENNQEDHTIYAINDLGQYEILNTDLSGLDDATEVKQIPSELAAIVQGINQTATSAGIEPLPRPWLPPLPGRIFVTDLHDLDRQSAWQGAKTPLAPVVGVVDVPSLQAQETLSLNLSADGHLALFASPGYGKSTFLQTVVMDLARAHSPAHLHAYLLDFGTNGLLPLRGLPHVADTLTVDDAEKAGKFAVRIDAEIKARKALLSRFAVANLEMYERASGEVLPFILIAIDGIEGLDGSAFKDRLIDLVHVIAREGAGLGIHLMISAGRQAAMRSSLSGNIKLQLALRLNDDSEARAIVGRTSLTIDDAPGRGMVKLEQPEIFQAALPAAGDDPLAIIDALTAETQQMTADWAGPMPEPIPVVPDTLTVAELVGRPGVTAMLAEGTIPVGLDFETVRPAGLNPMLAKQVLVLTPDLEEAATWMTNLWRIGVGGYEADLFVLDDDAAHLRGLQVLAGQPPLRPAAGLAAAVAELDARRAGFDDTAGGSLRDYANGLRPALVFVADCATLAEQLGRDAEADLLRLANDGPAFGMPLILGGTIATAGKGYDDFSKAVKRTTVALLTGTYADQSLVKASNINTYKEPALGESEGYLIAAGKATRVKVPQ